MVSHGYYESASLLWAVDQLASVKLAFPGASGAPFLPIHAFSTLSALLLPGCCAWWPALSLVAALLLPSHKPALSFLHDLA